MADFDSGMLKDMAKLKNINEADELLRGMKDSGKEEHKNEYSTFKEVEELDFRSKFSEKFKGLKIVKFEDILKKFAGQVIMNVHVKTLSDEYDTEAMKKIVALIRRYDCSKHVYFMISHRGVIKKFKEYAPDIKICAGHLASEPWLLVDKAIEFGLDKVQLFKPYFTQETIDKAHANGIKCNVFFADDPAEAIKYLEMGIDTILTNDYLTIANATKDLRNKKYFR